MKPKKGPPCIHPPLPPLLVLLLLATLLHSQRRRRNLLLKSPPNFTSKVFSSFEKCSTLSVVKRPFAQKMSASALSKPNLLVLCFTRKKYRKGLVTTTCDTTNKLRFLFLRREKYFSNEMNS